MLVSIIIPTFNSSAFIEETLDSIANQINNNYEVLVIDNLSRDGTVEIIKSHSLSTTGKLFFFINPVIGASASRNVGLKQSKGEYIVFLDADDLLTSDAIEILLANVGENDIIFGTWSDFDHYTKLRTNLVSYSESNSNFMSDYFRYKPTISTALLKRSEDLHWDETKTIWEVTDFFLNILIKGKAKFINHLVTDIRQHTSAERISIKYDHFNPLLTAIFFDECKLRLSIVNKLDKNTVAELDQTIITYCYEALKKNADTTIIKSLINRINVNSIKSYKDYKQFGIFHFTLLFRGYYGLKFFFLINKYLGRI